MLNLPKTLDRKQTGLTMVELLVALAIGSFLMIGAVQIYNQSRQAFVINESIRPRPGDCTVRDGYN